MPLNKSGSKKSVGQNDIGWAVEQLKAGRRVWRKQWAGIGVWEMRGPHAQYHRFKYSTPGMHVSENWDDSLHIDDVFATDWELAP